MKAIKTKTALDSFYHLKECLEQNSKVYFTRFGDGEILVMMGKGFRNHHSNKDVVKELEECITINNPLFLNALTVNLPVEKGMTDGVFKPYSLNNEFERFLIEKNFVKNDGSFENPVMFHYVSVFYPELMYSFLERLIRPRKKMFIGCTPKNIAEKLYGPIHYHVEIPRKFAYDMIDSWWPKVLENIDNVDLVIPSAGVSSNIVNKRLWNMNKDIHSIDIGSLIDAVDHKISRTWIRLVGHRVNKILPLEHREKRLKKKIIFLLKDIKYFFRRFIK